MQPRITLTFAIASHSTWCPRGSSDLFLQSCFPSGCFPLFLSLEFFLSKCRTLHLLNTIRFLSAAFPSLLRFFWTSVQQYGKSATTLNLVSLQTCWGHNSAPSFRSLDLVLIPGVWRQFRYQQHFALPITPLCAHPVSQVSVYLTVCSFSPYLIRFLIKYLWKTALKVLLKSR